MTRLGGIRQLWKVTEMCYRQPAGSCLVAKTPRETIQECNLERTGNVIFFNTGVYEKGISECERRLLRRSILIAAAPQKTAIRTRW